jgi:hypothetical protein
MKELLHLWADRVESWWPDPKRTENRFSSLLQVALAGQASKELEELLLRLLQVLEEGVPEQQIAKLPDTTRLLSRLLRFDCILCSQAAGPLFGCMTNLLPSLTNASPEVDADNPAKRKLSAMRNRCSEWCRERLYAATQGFSDDSSFGGHGSGMSPSIELLYDCGLSNSEITSSIATEALTALKDCEQQCVGVGDIHISQSDFCFLGTVLCLAAPVGGRSGDMLGDAGRILVRRMRLEAGTPSQIEGKSNWIDEVYVHLSDKEVSVLAVMHEEFLIKTIDELLTRLAESPYLHDTEIVLRMEAFLQFSKDSTWVLLAVEQALEGALVSLKYFHPQLACALSVVAKAHSCDAHPHRQRERQGAGAGGNAHAQLERTGTWLWDEWTLSNMQDDSDALHLCGVQQPHSKSADWPQACSMWHHQGPEVLLHAFATEKVTVATFWLPCFLIDGSHLEVHKTSHACTCAIAEVHDDDDDDDGNTLLHLRFMKHT